jgi:predicted Rossmann-fold nucleotide-binding protein
MSMGDDIVGMEGGFGSMSEIEKMALERSLRETRERRLARERHEKFERIAQLLGNEVNRRTIENQGENDD